MSLAPEVAYLRRQILHHLSLFFTAEARGLVEGDSVQFVSWDTAVHSTGPQVVIPVDIPASSQPGPRTTVAFNKTELTLWNPLPCPETPGWQSFPDDSAPLWYHHATGTLMPAWNLFGTLFRLLTFQEETETSRRDPHGRFIGSYSPRQDVGLLEVPAFNESVAALVAACAGLSRDGQPQLHLGGLLRAPVVVLSHDCDVLYGSDLWTQGVRAYRVLRPLKHARPPHLVNLWWMFRNALWPRRYYFDNVSGMLDLERIYGYRSTLYMLNGSGGRFGARSGTRGLDELSRLANGGWDRGVHYNYDTYLDPDRFSAQLQQLKSYTGDDLIAGRAHYLRFDPVRSPAYLEASGIRVDESAGYPDVLGYRSGIGGCFELYDEHTRSARDICEVPMIVMDATLVAQYGEAAIPTVRRMLEHLQRVGGALSVIFHPGVFHNPEFPEMLGVYHRLLAECRRVKARAMTARDLVNSLGLN